MNIAICGAGRAGTFLHYNVYNDNNFVKVVALVDPNEELVEEKSKELNIMNTFSSIEELVKSNIKIDIVSVCTNVATHYSVSKIALENGINVLVEKPATEENDQLDELYEIAKKNEVQFSVVHNHKFYPSFVSLRNLIESNTLGKLLHVDRVMSFDKNTIRMMEPDHWSHSFPGGRLFEANPHNLYLLHGFCGDLELQNIMLEQKNKNFPHVSISGFEAQFKNNELTANLKMTVNCDTQLYTKHAPSYFVCLFEKGSVYCDNGKILFLNRDLKAQFYDVGNQLISRIKALFSSKKEIGKGSGHYWFINKFIDSVKNDKTSIVSKDEAIFTQVMNLKMGVLVDEKLKS